MAASRIRNGVPTPLGISLRQTEIDNFDLEPCNKYEAHIRARKEKELTSTDFQFSSNI